MDTIVAIATPVGRGGIGIVRLSGPEAWRIAAAMVRLRGPLAAGRARFGELREGESGAVLDEVVCTAFAGPRSYTGEDVVEIGCHGAPVLLAYCVAEAVRLGARVARPGEFTERAFLSGRLDLAQAEAVGELVAAATLGQARVAAAQVGGALAREVRPAKEALLNLVAELEAGVDFAEDDLDLLADEAVASRIAAVREPIAALLATFGYGRVLREGLTLAIVGRPNAGKSTLFNRLLGVERAIVTAEAGTTRDVLGETLAIEGIPVHLVDTAGLREDGGSEAERIGMVRSREAMAAADMVVVARSVEDAAEWIEVPEGLTVLRVWTKVDLAAGRVPFADAEEMIGLKPDLPTEGLWTSAVSGEGMEELRRAIVAAAGAAAGGAEAAVVTNVRQRDCLARAADGLRRAEEGAGAGVPHEFLLLDLYAGLEALDEVTGATAAGEVLGRVFAGFCIGK